MDFSTLNINLLLLAIFLLIKGKKAIRGTKIQYQPLNAMLHLQVDIESTKIQYQPVNAMLLMKGG